ncbi:MAG: hypothetical protein WCO57_17245, partial [Verrucomicrobiota bacterium]
VLVADHGGLVVDEALELAKVGTVTDLWRTTVCGPSLPRPVGGHWTPVVRNLSDMLLCGCQPVAAPLFFSSVTP